jgi:hypothetical protein
MCIIWLAIKEGRKLRKYVASLIYRKERAHRIEDIVNERTLVPTNGKCSEKSIVFLLVSFCKWWWNKKCVDLHCIVFQAVEIKGTSL